MIGELERHKGELFHSGRLAYIPCQPWLFPGTIRENIVFGSEFVRHRYNQVLQACALSQVFHKIDNQYDNLNGYCFDAISNIFAVLKQQGIFVLIQTCRDRIGHTMTSVKSVVRHWL